MKQSVLILFIFFLVYPEFADAQKTPAYNLTHYTREKKLVSNYITSITQDQKGFIWIGSVNGLQRFDGTRFIGFHYFSNDKQGIPDNHILQLLTGKDQDLWISFGNGAVGRFNTSDFKFIPATVNLPDQRSLTDDRELMFDENGDLLYLYKKNTLLRYDKNKNEFSDIKDQIKTPPGWKIEDIKYDPLLKQYWIACDSGLVLYDRVNNLIQYRGNNPLASPVISAFENIGNVYNLLIDKKRRFWFTTWSESKGPLLYCYDLRSKKILFQQMSLASQIKKYNEPKELLEMRDSTIWLRGLSVFLKYDESLNRFISINNYDHENFGGLQFENLTCLFEDRESNLWAGTNDNGLYYFNPSEPSFENISYKNQRNGEPGSGSALSFLQDAGDLLFGAWGDGLFRLNKNLEKIPLHIRGLEERNDNIVWDMCKRKDGKIWMALQEGEVIIYDPVKRAANQIKPGILSGSTVRQVTEDRDGNMWLGTQRQGLFKWKNGSSNVDMGFSRFEAIPKTQITKLFVDSSGLLWVSAGIEGLYIINTSSEKIIKHITAKGDPGKKLLGIPTGEILQYNDSTMIIAGKGINILNTHTWKFSYITTEDGLPSVSIQAIQKDANGDLWASMINGLCRINIFQKNFSYFDRSDGIPNDNFTLLASYKNPDGRLFFGASNSVISFHPKEFIPRQDMPAVSITDVSVNNQFLIADSLFKRKQITLPYNQNSIALYFTSLVFNKKNKITYYYMLEGLEKDWVLADYAQKAIYNYLPPGEYTFKIKSVSSGNKTEEIIMLPILIKTPFWKSWWFYGFIGLAVAAVLFWIDRERMGRLKTIFDMRSSIAGNLHERVNTTLNNINVLSEIARLKADSDPEQSKDYIYEINQKSSSMIESMDDMLWSIDPANDSTEKIINRFKEHIAKAKSLHPAEIEFIADPNIFKLRLDMKIRYEAFLLFKDAINGFLHAGATKLNIYINQENSKLHFVIKNENAGCDLHQINNYFESISIKNRTDALQAKLEIKIRKSYTVYDLRIPI